MEVRAYLKNCYDYWRDILLLVAGMFCFLLASVSPFFFSWFSEVLRIPSQISFGLSMISIIILLPVAIIPWSFMREFPIGGEFIPPIWLPQDPMTWEDYAVYGRRYRYLIVTFIVANLVFFLGVLVYLFNGGAGESLEVPEDTGYLLFIIWIIINGLILIVFCVMEFFKTCQDVQVKDQ